MQVQKKNEATALLERIGVETPREKYKRYSKDLAVVMQNVNAVRDCLRNFGQLFVHPDVKAATEFHAELLPMAKNYQSLVIRFFKQVTEVNDIYKEQIQNAEENKSHDDIVLVMADVALKYNDLLINATQEIFPVAAEISDVLTKIDESLKFVSPIEPIAEEK